MHHQRILKTKQKEIEKPTPTRLKFILLDFYLFVWFVWLFCFKGRMVCHMHPHIPKRCKWSSSNEIHQNLQIFSVSLNALSLVRSSNVYSSLHFVCVLLDGTNNKWLLVSSWDDHFTLFIPSFFMLFPSSLLVDAARCANWASLATNFLRICLWIVDERSGRNTSLGASAWKVLNTFTSNIYAQALRHKLNISIQK